MNSIEDLRQLGCNPAFIAGIHNYCDRWCERCPMTAHCSVHAMEAADADVLGTVQPKAFWEQLSRSFETTAALLHELAQEAGIDLTAITDTAGSEDEFAAADDHILVGSARHYAHGVGDWFALWESRLYGAMASLDKEKHAHLQVVDPSPTPIGNPERMEIILRYHSLIPAKIHRAVMGAADEFEADADDFPRDADGSAKVALIAIDRSKAAWTGLIEAAPEARADILAFLGQLERLGRATEWTFPRARAFVRPGFDDLPPVVAPPGVQDTSAQ
ncbi:MAG: hypothetical protein JEZ11_12280 [Desulfobacterales bacterium]|nr:hypothetical protein [Desulfobacterales bacterium]